MQEPFIHKMQTNNNQYVYDVNSNIIVRCTKIVFDILPKIYQLSPFELSDQFGYQINDILTAELEIKKLATSRGLFSCNRPRKMQFNWENTQEILDKRISYLRLDITEQCNQRCTYCYFSGNYKKLRTHGKKMMSKSTAYDAVDFLLQHSRNSTEVRISFYGGEPLLNFHTVKDTVEYAKSRFHNRVSFDILTNGSLLDDEKVNFFVENDFWITLSIDGPSEIHDRNRIGINGEGTFTKVWEKIKKMRLRHPNYFREKVTIRCTMTSPTKLQQLIDFFSSNFVAEQEVSFSVVGHNSTPEECEISEWLIQLTQESYVNLYSKLLSKNLDVFRYLPRSLSKPIKDILSRKFTLLGEVIHPNKQCLPGAKWPTVTTEGKIIICDGIGYNMDLAIGDVSNNWNMKTIMSVIERYIDVSQECLTCWLIRLCPCCLTSAIDEKGQISRSTKETNCSLMKRKYELAFQEYLKLLEVDRKIFDYILDQKGIII